MELARRRGGDRARRRPARARPRCSAGMALKWRWRDRQQARRASRPTSPTWSWAPTCRCAGRSSAATGTSRCASSRWRATATTSTREEAVKHCDENTIGVVPVLGSTFDGSYEPVADICAALDQLQADTGLDIPVHVDGASGGFVAPFIDPDLVWDFRLPRVQSINASGHKYGLVYPGVGWVDLARPRRAARRPRVQRELPRRRHADVRAELLAARQPGRRAVLQLPAPRLRGLPARAAGVARRRALHSRTRSATIGPFELHHRRQRAPGVRVRARRPEHRELHRVRRLRAPARPRLAGAGVHASPRTARTSRRCASSCATASPATSPTCWSPTCKRHTRVLREAPDDATARIAARRKSFSH